MSKKSSEQIITYAEKSIAQVEREMIRAYKKALIPIRAELMKLAEKTEMLTAAEVNKYNRLSSLKQSIEKELTIVKRNVSSQLKGLQKNVFIETYEKSIASIGVDLGFGKINPDAVRASIEKSLSTSSISDLMEDVTRTQFKKIDRAITQGIIQGLSIPKISKMIKEAMESTLSRAKTIARTETLRVMSIAQLQVTEKLEERGFKTVKVWTTAQDDRVRPANKYAKADHRMMEGQESIDGWFTLSDGSKTEAPRLSCIANQDCNCRCRYFNRIYDDTGKIISGE